MSADAGRCPRCGSRQPTAHFSEVYGDPPYAVVCKDLWHDAPAQAAEPEDGGFTCRECGYSAHLDSLMAVHQRETGHRKPASEMAAGEVCASSVGSRERDAAQAREQGGVPRQPPVPSPGEFEEAHVKSCYCHKAQIVKTGWVDNHDGRGRVDTAKIVCCMRTEAEHPCVMPECAALREAHARAMRAAEEEALERAAQIAEYYETDHEAGEIAADEGLCSKRIRALKGGGR